MQYLFIQCCCKCLNSVCRGQCKHGVVKVGIWGVESDDSGRSWGHPNALWNLVIMFKKYMGKLGSEAYRFILIKPREFPL